MAPDNATWVCPGIVSGPVLNPVAPLSWGDPHAHGQIISFLGYGSVGGLDCLLTYHFSQKMCLSKNTYPSGGAGADAEIEGNGKILDPADLKF